MEGTGEREATREGRRAGVRGRRELGKERKKRESGVEEMGDVRGRDEIRKSGVLSEGRKMNDKEQCIMSNLENDKK